MPITASLDDGNRIKARTYEPDRWRDMIGSKQRPAFWCSFCEGAMHPKTSASGLQFFAHNPGGPDCTFRVGTSSAESVLHMQLKDYITAAVDLTAGWDAMPEQRVEVDGSFYVADVLATRIDGKKSPPGVFEVQLSREPDAHMLDRNAIRSASGAVTTWLTRTEVPWFRRMPTLRIDTTDTGRVQIIDGLMKSDTDKAPQTLLERFIAKRLAGHYAFVENVGIIRKGDWVERPEGHRTKPTGRTGGRDDCDRTPVAPKRATVNMHVPDVWTMNLPAASIAGPGEVECGWLGCPAPATSQLQFPSGADWMPNACTSHAMALADRYGAAVTGLT